MSRPGQQAPIIIKRKKIAAHGHHGGAWKVAYADFVTAMMAFFLLLWLLNVTTQQQKQAIANYFDPTSVSDSTSGSGGVMGGTTMTSQGAQLSDAHPIGESIPVPGDPAQAEKGDVKKEKPENDPVSDPFAASEQSVQGEGKGSGQSGTQSQQQPAATQGTSQAQNAANLKGASDKDLAKNAEAKAEDQNFKQAEAAIRQAIQSVPELQALSQNLLVDETPDGLRIQLVDQDGSAMFPSAGSEMFDRTRKLLAVVAHTVQKMPNQITIHGHTDSTPFHSSKGYDNWDLSTDRANASRRALVEAGLNPDKISSVVGKADREPLFPESPNAAENRRISIVLLRSSAAGADTGDSSAPAPMGHITAKPD